MDTKMLVLKVFDQSVVCVSGMYLPASLVGLALYYAINLLNVQQPALRKSAAVHFKVRKQCSQHQHNSTIVLGHVCGLRITCI